MTQHRKPKNRRSVKSHDSDEAVWDEFHLKMQPNHGWRAKPGNAIFSFGRGLLMFEIPSEWEIVIGVESVKFYDLKPPDDNVTLEVSLLPVPADKLAGVPLVALMRGVCSKTGVDVPPENVIEVERIGLHYCWHEYTDLDEVERRPAIFRTCFARGSGLHALFSFAFWPEDRERFSPVWNDVLASIQFGQYFTDPRIGPVLH